ncbi:uncharacterized protein BJX67DRAFT_345472 [Aspergillus lucknowensis]|uniref:Uncharacterized protein n=1 Tax=Aspergillus lucknowensis TaxID=176173 RepID=A0ABR4M0T2_9EURO
MADKSDEPSKQTPSPTFSPPTPSPPPSITEEAEITPATESSTALVVQEKVDADAGTPTAEPQHPPTQQVQDYDPSIGAKPYSPFYRHATPSSKLGQLTSHRKCSRSVGMVTSPIDDVEGGGGGRPPPWQRLYDGERTGRESKLWVQEKRYCDCLSRLGKKQRMAVKIAIAVVILGSMVAIALGITAAVGGGVWKGDHQQARLGS